MRISDWSSDVCSSDLYRQLAGLYPNQAQKRIAELLEESADLDGEPRPITHPVKFYENGDRPLEIVSSRQWYIRNGGQIGRASCRERVCQYVQISVGAVPFKKKHKRNTGQ